MKKNMEPVTLDSFIKRAAARKESTAEPLKVYVPALDGELEFTKPNTFDTMDYRRRIAEGELDENKLYTEVIYNNCKLLQSKELHEALGVKDPVNVVPEIFTLIEIQELARAILNHDSLDEDIEVIKN